MKNITVPCLFSMILFVGGAVLQERIQILSFLLMQHECVHVEGL